MNFQNLRLGQLNLEIEILKFEIDRLNFEIMNFEYWKLWNFEFRNYDT